MTTRIAARRRVRTAITVLAGCALATGGLLVARQGCLALKARAAEVLIDRAWAATLADGRPHRPWPWADFTPVGRIEARRLGVDRPILSDASGRTLAFGLGHLAGSARPGARGTCAIAGHRDTWAAFLADLRDDDIIVVRTPRGPRLYRVASTAVLDRRLAAIRTAPAAGEWRDDRLLLVTCWPFDSIRRGDLRYVVTCLPAASTPGAPTRVTRRRRGGAARVDTPSRAALHSAHDARHDVGPRSSRRGRDRAQEPRRRVRRGGGAPA
jgi:sortase A